MSRVITALGLAVLSVVALSSPASATTRSFSCTPSITSNACGKPFPVPSGKSVWVNFDAGIHLAGFKAYNTVGNHFLGGTNAAYSSNVRLWFNDTNRTIRVRVRAFVATGANVPVSGTHWVG